MEGSAVNLAFADLKEECRQSVDHDVFPCNLHQTVLLNLERG